MARETWVLNASPLIVLAKSGRLDLLLDRARELLIPEAVAREVGAAPANDPARLALEAGFAGSPQVVQASGDVLEWGLGDGESAVFNPLVPEERLPWSMIRTPGEQRWRSA
ncbi:MAG: hypothetical protein M3495_20230 [Pseudomonadota bacterium]|nr:hypothetical protein [Pseudomonadota bacterium]